jgi:hypothetical protein
MPKAAPAAAAAPSAAVLLDVVAWLEKRKHDVPATLRAACPPRPPDGSARPASAKPPADESAEFKWAIGLLGGELRERDRRALVRFVQKAASGGADKKQRTDDPNLQPASDDEGAASSSAPDRLPEVRGGAWPAEVEYSNNYRWGSDVPAALAAVYRPAAVRPRPARPCPRTFAAVVTEAGHPAAGECGLFAAVGMAVGAYVIDYVGAISLGENEDKTSDYVCDFGESECPRRLTRAPVASRHSLRSRLSAESELALDARHVGNEGRFVNDYRNTGRHANVEFRLRRDARGEMRQGIYVCAKQGVRPGDELLISYGKSYWRSRVEGSMEDFIVRRPGVKKS